jgi:hypothetical protein
MGKEVGDIPLREIFRRLVGWNLKECAQQLAAYLIRMLIEPVR